MAVGGRLPYLVVKGSRDDLHLGGPVARDKDFLTIRPMRTHSLSRKGLRTWFDEILGAISSLPRSKEPQKLEQ